MPEDKPQPSVRVVTHVEPKTRSFEAVVLGIVKRQGFFQIQACRGEVTQIETEDARGKVG